jgi:hypothetical protein
MHLSEDLFHLPACLNIDETLERLTTIAAAVIDAEQVSIMLWKDGSGAPAADVGPDPLGLKLHAVDSGMRALPVQIDGLTIGEVRIHQPKCVAIDNSRLLAVFALFIGKSIQAAQLQAVLRSRFAQLALAQSAGRTLGDAVALSSQNPNQVARILAKSFYRELASAGFSVRQIINAATEIISEVSASLKRHKKRQLRDVSSG